MALTADEKTQIINEYATHEGDTGSPEVQVALLTKRIADLTEHLKEHKHDHHSRRGMQLMIGDRRRLLDYLKRVDINRYRSLIAALGLRTIISQKRAEYLALCLVRVNIASQLQRGEGYEERPLT